MATMICLWKKVIFLSTLSLVLFMAIGIIWIALPLLVLASIFLSYLWPF